MSHAPGSPDQPRDDQPRDDQPRDDQAHDDQAHDDQAHDNTMTERRGELQHPDWPAEQAAAAARLARYALNNPTLTRLAELASRLLATPAAQVSLLTDAQVAVVGHGLPPGTIGNPVPFADSMCLVAASAGVPLAVPDARLDDRLANGEKVVGGLIRAYLGVPLVSDGGLTVGSLCVFDPQPREWSDHDVAMLEQIASSVRAELELAALTREYETDKARWELAVDASDVGTFDWDLVGGDLAWDDRLIALYGYDVGDVEFDRSIDSVSARVHPDDLELLNTSMSDAIAAVGPIHVVYRIVVPPGHVRWLEARGRALASPEDPDGPAVRLLGISWDVTEQQQGQARADRVLDTMPVGFLGLDAEWRVTSYNGEAARLMNLERSRVVGQVVWDLHRSLPGSVFETAYRRAVATGVSETVEGYIPAPTNTWFEVRAVPSSDGLSAYFFDVTERHETQERIEQAAQRDRTVAQTLQSVLLTELPVVDGLTVTGRYLTAAVTDQVGGDWYDAIRHGDDAVTVMIGDVMGHDIAAAATMGQLRAMLRMSAWASAALPSHLVSQLDAAARDLRLKTIVTLAVCRIQPPQAPHGPRTMRWTNAGHPPPILLESDGSTRVLTGDRIDIMLGVAPESERHDHEATLPPGSTVILYTDGLVESRANDLDAGIDRLRQALTRHHRLGPQALIDAVLADLVGEQPDDDTAALAVHVH